MATPGSILNQILTLIASSNPTIAALLAVCTVGISIFEMFDELWTALFARLDTVILEAAPTLGLSPFGIINGMFPLDTTLTYLGAYLTLYLVCTGIRTIKSFMPTIAG
jgi:hypothetical protein